MKKMLITLAVLMVVGMVAEMALADSGAPSGPHFNLNIIGMKKDKNSNIGCGEGHRIFVPMEGTKSGRPPVKILLTQSPDDETFAVIDCDGTDGTAAFMLPNPDPGDGSNCTKYSVYIRPRGIPGGKAKIRTCAERCIEVDEGGECVTWEEVCSTESVELERKSGKQRFINVSKEMLTLCVEVCVEWDTDPESPTFGDCLEWDYRRVYLFDPILQNYFWEYDNNGLKLAQVRFYLQPTCYTDDEWECPAK